jgi:DNA ligase-1
MAFKPMLAATLADIDQLLEYPLGATPKIDGIRAIIRNGKLVSRTLKPIRNSQICQALEAVLPEGADGEIVTNLTNLQQTTSDVMTSDKPIEHFTYYWFDWVGPKPYLERMAFLQEYDLPETVGFTIVKLQPTIVNNKSEVVQFENDVLSMDYEGVILRSLDGDYKYGRSTLREGYLMKLKRFTDSEAEIVSVEELIHQDGSKGNTLGCFVAQTPKGVEFKIGTGFTQEQRDMFWAIKENLPGEFVKYKYFDVSIKTAPRHPVFLAMRDPMDM